MAKLSSMVRRRRKAARGLRNAVTEHGRRAVEGLEKRMAAVLEEGEPMPDVGHVIDVLSRMLERESEELDEADSERWSGTAEVESQRFRRNPVFLELRQQIVDLRDSLKGVYGGKQANQILGIKGRTPRGFEHLLYYAEWLEQALRTTKLPPTKVKMDLDPVAWADDLKPLVTQLSESSDRVLDGWWGEGSAVVARNRKIGGFDADVGPVTRLIESVYLLGGEIELARRLRPNFRRQLVNRSAAMSGHPGQDSEDGEASGETGETSEETGGLLRRIAPGLFRDDPSTEKKVC